MRFKSNGPSIPNELLNDRDNGQVVFICGAGVSLNKAGLPNFLDLTEKVIKELDLEKDHAIYKLLDADKEIQDKTNHSLLSLDRIFGLLERDFSIHDIEHYVAKTLKPMNEVDLSAHQTLLKLAKTPDGNTQLITTNFDRLFEDCDKSLTSYVPPKLPILTEDGRLNCITHLHGIVNKDYTKSDGNGFVLSSSEFGSAYLVEAWATKFIQSILKEYSVVFVGYIAEDPPVRYLLEALKKQSHLLQNIYAFHFNGDGNAKSAWESKGVEPIEYDEHHLLWDTLSLWAKRAEDPKDWMLNTLTQLNTKPSEMEAFQRGQVSHIVSTNEGMHIMANMAETLLAEWLCVFDSSLRYSKPTKIKFWDDESTEINPFDRYHLDDDTPPMVEQDNSYHKQVVSASEWNCLSLTKLDKKSLIDKNNISIFDINSYDVHNLSSRLVWFSQWIIKAADSPIVLWWVIKKGGLNLSIVEDILYRLQREERIELFEIWNDLLQVWKIKNNEQTYKMYQIEDYYEKQQWSDKLLNEVIERYYQPILKIDSNLGYTSFPPVDNQLENLHDLVKFELEYKNILELNIDKEWLSPFIKKFRNIIERVIELEKSYSIYPGNIDPFYKIPEKDEHVHYAEGLSVYVHHFKSLLEKLSEYNVSLLREEYFKWDMSDESVFAHLGMWVSSQSNVLSGEEAGNSILNLPENVIWERNTQRDLLISLSNRWNEYPLNIRKKIEIRLLKGRDEDGFENYNAWGILNRTQYLHENGCKFSFDFEQEKKKLKIHAPDWKEENAQEADESYQGFGGIVNQNSDCNDLLLIPLSGVLEKAQEMMKDRTIRLHENKPFTGLSQEKPLRALSVLTNASRNGECPEWAWQAFLYAQENKSTKLTTLIAYRVMYIPLENLKNIKHPLLSWYEKVTKTLKENSPELFESIWDKIILLIKTFPEIGTSGMTSNSKHYEWLTHASISPQGKLSELWISMLPEKIKSSKKLIKKDLIRVEELLNLPTPANRFSLVIFSQNLSWFYARNTSWTTKHILSFLKKLEEDKEALLAGLLGSRTIPSIELMKLLKKDLIEFVIKNTQEISFTKNLVYVLLVLWATMDEKSSDRIISNDEMREILLNSTEKFRLKTLWSLSRFTDNKEVNWDDNTIEFIKNVWPRQIKIKTSNVSFQLNNLAFSNSKLFNGISNDVIRLTKGYLKKDFNFQRINIEDSEIIEKYSEDVLNFLDEVLTEDIFRLPYGLDNILSSIVTANLMLSENTKLIKLQRRCNAN
jgi:hypothetical protein